LVVNLASLGSGWPQPVQDELVRFNLAQAEVSLPVAQVASALKTGQFTITWKQLCGWIKPPLPTAATVTPPETPLKLPLQAIVPLFMAQQRPEKPKQKVIVADHIPDVFHGIVPAPAPSTPAEVAPLPAPEEAAYPSAETAAAAGPPELAKPAPAFGVIELPEPPPELAQAARDLQRLFKKPTQDNWTPAELVEELAKMPGVGGALIAMQDGLLVANRIQPNLNGDMLAAFLPQLFGRLEQYAKELMWGEIRSLNFEVDNMAVHIFNVGYVYFTVLGRAGEDLPLTSIKAVVAYLDQQYTHH
jgi:predicted regulator of Ras-like GTPase activity (Roadblock/LC7/MglB family)